ncbi:hypothetical protein B5566_16395 [Mycobacterium sp. MHSD3]|uniref:Uncharacterized protein n=1 Tax=Mycobacteroides chelonae TaxID=1774 RepID=A0AB73U6L1_MYCCH|nr:hypothetical protein DYE20_17935 [[Mycobacterium] chelonae subsp. gwanakae]PKQ56908.1 hypothetical protein B5566_16395 [Mycobacterium sp. MHSD3]QDF71848.1 hypothetical protein FJK96_17940 [Mycobacteroides chelonae]
MMASEAPNAVAPTAVVQTVIRVAASATDQPSSLSGVETMSFIARPYLVVLRAQYARSRSRRGDLTV